MSKHAVKAEKAVKGEKGKLEERPTSHVVRPTLEHEGRTLFAFFSVFLIVVVALAAGVPMLATMFASVTAILCAACATQYIAVQNGLAYAKANAGGAWARTGGGWACQDGGAWARTGGDWA